MAVEVGLEDQGVPLLEVLFQSHVLVLLQPLELAVLLHITAVPKPAHYLRSGQSRSCDEFIILSSAGPLGTGIDLFEQLQLLHCLLTSDGCGFRGVGWFGCWGGGLGRFRSGGWGGAWGGCRCAAGLKR